jgi:hypothetical protein
VNQPIASEKHSGQIRNILPSLAVDTFFDDKKRAADSLRKCGPKQILIRIGRMND